MSHYNTLYKDILLLSSIIYIHETSIAQRNKQPAL